MNANLGFMVAQNDYAQNILYRTNDGGRRWILVPSPPALP